MHTSNIRPVLVRKELSIIALLLLSGLLSCWASTFTWTALVSGSASGSWINQANWDTTLPTTSSDVADFSTLDITANSVVGLTNGNVTLNINSLIFGDADTSTPAGWTLIGSGNLQSLTLGGSNPTIIVNALGVGAGVTNNLVLAGSGFIKDGPGLLALTGSGANTFTGPTYVTNGTLVLSKSDNVAAISGDLTVGTNTTVFSKAKNQLALNANLTNYGYLDFGGKTMTVNSLVLDNNAIITNGSGSVYITNATTYDVRSGMIYLNLAGAAGLTKTTPGLVVLTNGSGANIYTGNTTVSGGILQLGHSGTGQGLPGTTVTVTAGGTLLLGKDTQINPSATVDINGGTFELSQHSEEFGTLILENGGTILNGGSTSKTLSIDANMDFRSGVCSSRLGGIGVLVKSTTGTVTLTLDNTNAGGVLISAGILQLGDGSSTNRGQFGQGFVTNNAAVVLNHSSTFNLTNTISGTGSITNLGGAPTFTGANTYSGDTTVSGGTLFVGNTSGSGTGSGNVLVQAGATLGGNGVIGGAVVNFNSSTLAPGNASGSGTLTINGNLTLNGGSINIFKVTGGGSPAATIALGGNVTYGGILNIVPSGTFSSGQNYTLFSGAGAASASNFSSIQGTPGVGLSFSFTNGVLSVVSTGSTPTPAQITASISGNALTLTWPAGQGWTLQGQTNSLSTGLTTTGWGAVSGGVDGSISITIDPTQPAVFYRLKY